MKNYFFCVLLSICLFHSGFSQSEWCDFGKAFPQPGQIIINHDSFKADCKEWFVGDLHKMNKITLKFSSINIDCRISNIIVLDEQRNKIHDFCKAFHELANGIQVVKRNARYLIIDTILNQRAKIGTQIEFSTEEVALETTSFIPPVVINEPVPQIVPELNSMSCGKPSISPSDFEMRIIGGSPAVPNSWPWQVLITDTIHMCGGSLINSEWVLTAAHCIDERYKNSMRAYLGMHNLTGAELRNSPFVRITQVVPHANYNDITKANDIALLKLETPVTFSDRVSPICLPSQNASPGRVGIVIGWGVTSDFGRFSNVLLQVPISVNENRVCPFRLTQSQLCAGNNINGRVRDSCQGDSGGPLMLKEGDQFVVSGIVSFGGPLCDGRGVYANVFAYLDWIDQNMK